jgi:hypothetical protein
MSAGSERDEWHRAIGRATSGVERRDHGGIVGAQAGDGFAGARTVLGAARLRNSRLREAIAGLRRTISAWLPSNGRSSAARHDRYVGPAVKEHAPAVTVRRMRTVRLARSEFRRRAAPRTV